MMRYFKLNNEVFAFEESDVKNWVKPEMVEMTYEEIDRHLNPQNYLTDAEKRAAYLATVPVLTKRQFNLYMYDNGHTAEIEAIFAANPRAKIEFDSVRDIERTHPTTLTMIAALGWTEEQVDSMWQQALTL